MQMKQLGNTGIQISKIGLGTMTWGEQNTKEDAFEQMDYALERGVNLFDTAEMYSVPPKEATCGQTELHIGEWLAKTGNRDKIILASKVAGPGVKWIRGAKGFTKNELEETINSSLKRLQTDYIDLYQLHWPQRQVPMWGKANYHEAMHTEGAKEQMLEYYFELDKFIQNGKIRHIGVSNETPWGVMTYQALAQEHNLPPMASIQNAYSVIRREYEGGLAEISMYEKISLLAYSPLAGGLLSGKYQNGFYPANARFSLFPSTMGYYNNDKTAQAVKKYQAIADEAGISLTTLSLAFVNDRKFVASNLIGATSIKQLEENIASADVSLSKETLKQIEDVYKELPNTGAF